MIKFAKVINNETGLCEVGIGTNTKFYISIGMTEQDVEQSDIDNNWYLAEKCPHKSEEEKLEEAKELKYRENDTKASDARYGQEFTLTIQEQECVFDTTEQTQRDLLTAFAVCSTGQTYGDWVTNNGVVLDLTMEDVALISQIFKEKSNVYDKWNLYKQAIADAQTIEEVEAIEIIYNISEERE